MQKNILIDSDDLSGEGIDQAFLVIKDREKHKYLTDFINQNKGQVIVFCSTKIRTRNVARDLTKSRYKVVAIEGDMSQNKREYSMMKFRKKSGRHFSRHRCCSERNRCSKSRISC